MATRKRLSADERRAEIMSAARRVFLRYGYEGTKTRSIAEEAGVTEAVLYRHFRSKEHLFEESILKAHIKQRTDLLMRCRAFAEAALSGDRDEALEAEQDLFDIMNSALPTLGALLYADPESGGKFYRENWMPRSKRMIETHSGSFVAPGTVDPSVEKETAKFLLTAIYGANFGLALHRQFSGDDAESPVAALTDLALHGVGPR